MAEDLAIVPPDKSIFKSSGFQREAAKSVVGEASMYIFDHMEYPEGGGMLAYFKDCPFPTKGMPFPQFIYACNTAKRFWRRNIEVLASKEMILPLFGFLLSWKKVKILEKWLDAYADGALSVLQPYLLADDKYAECPRELRAFIGNFLDSIGVEKGVAEKFAEVFSLIIQGDDAYRIRIEDIMSETTKERMVKNPAKEIVRLMKVLESRELQNKGTFHKFNKMAVLLRILLTVPKFKRAFRKGIQKSDFKNFQLDDLDRYHSMLRFDYNVMGYTYPQRYEMYKVWSSIFPPEPPRVRVKLQQ